MRRKDCEFVPLGALRRNVFQGPTTDDAKRGRVATLFAPVCKRELSGERSTKTAPDIAIEIRLGASVTDSIVALPFSKVMNHDACPRFCRHGFSSSRHMTDNSRKLTAARFRDVAARRSYRSSFSSSEEARDGLRGTFQLRGRHRRLDVWRLQEPAYRLKNRRPLDDDTFGQKRWGKPGIKRTKRPRPIDQRSLIALLITALMLGACAGCPPGYHPGPWGRRCIPDYPLPGYPPPPGSVPPPGAPGPPPPQSPPPS